MNLDDFKSRLAESVEKKVIEATLPTIDDISQISERMNTPANPFVKEVVDIAKRKNPLLQKILEDGQWDIDNFRPNTIEIENFKGRYLITLGYKAMNMPPDYLFKELEIRYLRLLRAQDRGE